MRVSSVSDANATPKREPINDCKTHKNTEDRGMRWVSIRTSGEGHVPKGATRVATRALLSCASSVFFAYGSCLCCCSEATDAYGVKRCGVVPPGRGDERTAAAES